MEVEVARFAAISQYNPFAVAESHTINLELTDHLHQRLIEQDVNPWFLTPARMDTILRIYFGLKPHDPDVASCPFIQYFASISGYANGLLVSVIIKELIIYARAASEEEVLHMIECIDNPESSGEGGVGLHVHSEEELNVYLQVKITS